MIICITIPTVFILAWMNFSLLPERSRATVPNLNSQIRIDSFNKSDGLIRESSSNSLISKIAYLTFDDGPSEYTPRLLDILQQKGVKATFFVTFRGKDLTQKREWLQLEAKYGETIGVKSWTNNDTLIYASPQNFKYDYSRMKQVIIEATGIVPQICRFPGISDSSAFVAHKKIMMSQIKALTEEMGFKAFGWTAGGEDSRPSYSTQKLLVQDILRDVQGKTHVIILMHDTNGSSVDAIPVLIDNLRAQGYCFATLTRMTPSVQGITSSGPQMVA